MPTRRLPQIYGSDATLDAISNADPNSLNSNKPSRKDASGVSGPDCIVSLTHDYTATDPDLTLWFWSERLFQKTGGVKAWIKASEAAAGNTKTVPGYTLASFTIPENTPFFLQGSLEGIRNCWLGGSRKDDMNPNADWSDAQADTA